MAQMYDKVRNMIWDETPEEEADRKTKAVKGLQIADRKAKAIEEDKRKRGYCKRCGLLLPVSGICECGCREKRKEVQKDVINHKTGQVKGGWVHPGILALYDK